MEIENNVLPFKLWVDADALPKILREVILRASDRYQLEVIFVANQNVGITPSVRIKSIQVLSGADQADQEIVDRMSENDIVITQDIPLAAQVIEKVVSRFIHVVRFIPLQMLRHDCTYVTLWTRCVVLESRQVVLLQFQNVISVNFPVHSTKQF